MKKQNTKIESIVEFIAIVFGIGVAILVLSTAYTFIWEGIKQLWKVIFK